MVRGIDISRHQQTFDARYAKRNKINTVFVRTGYGFGKDEKYDDFISSCKSSSLRIGVYHFLTFHYASVNNRNFDSAMEAMNTQIDNLLEIIKDDGITSWVALDEELESNLGKVMGLTKEQNTDILIAAGNKVREAGYVPCLYASASWIEQYVDLNKLNMKLWVAYYPQYPNPIDFDDLKEIPDTRYGNMIKRWKNQNKVCIWQFNSVGFGDKYGVGSSNLDKDWIYLQPKIKDKEEENPKKKRVIKKKSELEKEKKKNKRKVVFKRKNN